MKVLQLGKFYPIRGGVEKVMWDVTAGLSAEGVDCDMLCATLDSDPVQGHQVQRSWARPDSPRHYQDGCYHDFSGDGTIPAPALQRI